ncbi:MAG: threonine--tRNA ligase [Thermoproteota archaeon]|jgi:threonyl-tRNA synthetase|nr:threonine--tRNA ligase [Thermoproteota archaeon]
MRLLQLHSDFVEYQPIAKEIREAEENVSSSKVRFEDLVVSLVAIENGDDENLAKIAVNEIERYLATVKSKRLLIYPYAHLTSDLALPERALEVILSIEKFAKERFVDVHRAPFGWTKAFEIKVKGHPLAENYKIVTKQASNIAPVVASNSDRIINSWETKVSSALREEEKLSSIWYILEPDGKLSPIKDYKFKAGDQNLHTLANYEMAKKRLTVEQPAHVRLMKRMGIADYEPASDVGNLRYYPKGKLMKSLIEQYVTQQVMEYGGMEVETPIMYDSKHPSLESYFNRFPARQYTITSDNNKQLFLRFAACFGQFLMAKDFQLSYKHLPLKLYELTRYSFRREKSGELSGLRRLRAFSMPDCHALCSNMEQAKEELLRRFELSTTVINALGLSTTNDLEMAIRFTEDFYNGNQTFINKIVSRYGRPVLVEIWKDRSFYFILKWEFNYIDSTGKASALSTDQIDVENGSRYGIEFVDENGKKKNPIILHNSPSGAVERVMFALLENCAKVARDGGKPSLPLWLAHTQVRIIPVSTQHLDLCREIYTELSRRKVRTDIDDRNESVANKIRQSETEWINYTIVIGDKELQTGWFVVRDRNQGEQRKIVLAQLGDEINSLTNGKPYIPLNLPPYLSNRPQIMV